MKKYLSSLGYIVSVAVLCAAVLSLASCEVDPSDNRRPEGKGMTAARDVSFVIEDYMTIAQIGLITILYDEADDRERKEIRDKLYDYNAYYLDETWHVKSNYRDYYVSIGRDAEGEAVSVDVTRLRSLDTGITKNNDICRLVAKGNDNWDLHVEDVVTEDYVSYKEGTAQLEITQLGRDITSSRFALSGEGSYTSNPASYHSGKEEIDIEWKLEDGEYKDGVYHNELNLYRSTLRLDVECLDVKDRITAAIDAEKRKYDITVNGERERYRW